MESLVSSSIWNLEDLFGPRLGPRLPQNQFGPRLGPRMPHNASGANGLECTRYLQDIEGYVAIMYR